MYAELHAKSNFSFLEGASHPEELVDRAAELGYAAVAVTDRNSLAGVVRAHVAAKQLGMKLVIGAEITPDDAPSLVLWPTDRAAYGRLARLITLGRRRAEKGECRLTLDDIAGLSEGLIAGVCGGQCSVLSTQCRRVGQACAASAGPPKSFAGGPALASSLAPPYGPHPSSLISRRSLLACRDIFPDRCYLLAELHYRGDDQSRLDQLASLAREANVPLAAAGDVYFHEPARQPLNDVLTAVRHGCTVASAGELLYPNAQRYLRPPAEMAAIFARYPAALGQTLEIAAQATFSLDELRYEYPEELAPPGQTPMQYLTRLAWEGARDRYPSGVPEKVRGLIEHELRLIEDLRYEAYFLTVWDLVVFARGRGILCQGRGSAANSAVCYCLGVTSVDPERMDLLFERFVSRERNEAPDIDVDFEHERREEVLQYLYQKYGRERAGMTAEVITYRPRSAVRDVGKALGMTDEAVDRLAKRIEHREEVRSEKSEGGSQKSEIREPSGDKHDPAPVPLNSRTVLAERCREAGLDADSLLGRQLIELVRQLIGFPRHLSQHTGGMVMTRGPLCEMVPIENAAMPERTVIQWNKDDLDELGILKVDCLALGMLTAIRKCFALVKQHYGNASAQDVGWDQRAKDTDCRRDSCERRPTMNDADDHGGPTLATQSCPTLRPFPLPTDLTLANIPEGDEGVYEMIRRADTMGVFQIESRAQMSMLPRLKPRCFYDLVIEVAIVRPGPIQGNMVHPYLRRRNKEEDVTYPNEAVRNVLEKTLGVPLFQEQAMRLAVEAAGFTPGEADQLRRAMGAWRRPGVIDQFHRKLTEGMLARGFTPDWAEAVFRQIRGFGEYGFPESHAASFALLVYVSCWLKHHFMAAFTAALVNSQPMGFYAPAQLVRNAREHGVEVRPVDVNASEWDCTLEKSGEWEGRSRKGEVESAAHCLNSPLPTSHSPLSLRLGFRMLRGLLHLAGERIVTCRGEKPYTSIDDFTRRTRFGRAVIMRLARAGVFGSLENDRRHSLWDALAQDPTPLPLFDAAEDEAASDSMSPILHPSSFIPHPFLPAMTPPEQVLADYRTTGLSLLAHPLSFLRGELEKLRVIPAGGLRTWPDGRWVRVAGLVLVRQRPSTAKGITFVTLEDETATANLIIRPEVWKRFRMIALNATVLIASGPLQRQEENIHVLVARLEDFSVHLSGMLSQSRDFC
jgi:error-prone DNA polymerase